MRVLLIAHGYPPTASGGTELYVNALAHTLRDAGDEVHVFARGADPTLPEHAMTHAAEAGIAVTRLNHTFRDARAFTDSYRSATIRRLFGRLVDDWRPDVAHVHHLTGLSADLLEELATRRVPTLMTLHDYWLICHRGQLLDRRLERCEGPLPGGCDGCLGAEACGPAAHRGARWLRALERRRPRLGQTLRPVATALAGLAAARGAPAASASAMATLARARHMQHLLRLPDLLLAPSRTLRDQFLAFGVPPEKLVLQELGIPLEPYTRLRRRDAGHLRLGFFGSLMVSKAPHLLLEAFGRLDAGEATVDVFGDHVAYHGDDGYRGRLEPLLRQPGVRHHGGVPHAAVPAALAEVDVVVVPSIWLENSPLVVREAFAAGAPVVASDLGAMAETVAESRNGLLFRAGDAGDLHRCLRRLLDETELLPQLRSGIPAVRDLAADAAWTRRRYAETLRGGAPRAPHPPRPRLAAVVLHYRTPADTLLAARSLEASRRPVDDLLIVDNGSADGSVEWLGARLPGAILLETGANLGFPAGCNAGIRLALERAADLVLLLNSDALLPPDALEQLELPLTSPEVGIAGPLLLSRSDPDHLVSAGMRYAPGSGRMLHLLAGHPAPPPGGGETRAVDGVSGCAMLVKREVFERIGLLAEEYFFSFEDLDFCLRARAAGFTTVCSGASRGYHEGGQTIGARSPARLYYAARNHLLLASRAARDGTAFSRAARFGAVVGLNLAHALLRSGTSRPAAVAAVLRGSRDHLRGRYGAAPQ